MDFCVQQGLGRLMVGTSLVVNTVNCTVVLHDPLRTGKVRALNEKLHQHLLRTEISVQQCHSQFLLAAFVIPFLEPTGKIKEKSFSRQYFWSRTM